MTDIKSSEERSLNMSKIRGKDTKPEIYFRKKLFEKGYRYRKNVNYITGHPDIWLSKYNTAVFVHGCYWHRHKDCKYAYMPKSRIEFWSKKFSDNINRDRIVRDELSRQRIRILIIWECRIREMMKSEIYEKHVMDMITVFLSSTEEMLLEI